MKHRFKTIDGAVRRIKEIQKVLATSIELIDRFNVERKALAKLAAKGPCFFNPLEAFAAESIRDDILRDMGLNPDGSFINKGTPCQT